MEGTNQYGKRDFPTFAGEKDIREKGVGLGAPGHTLPLHKADEHSPGYPVADFARSMIRDTGIYTFEYINNTPIQRLYIKRISRFEFSTVFLNKITLSPYIYLLD